MSTNNKIEIKSNWDERIRRSSNNNDYEKLLELKSYRKIKNFLIRNDSGSLIISGDRGAGKTTALISVLKSCESKTFPIYLNSLCLESFEPNNPFSLVKILKQLTKSLHRELILNDIKRPKELQELLDDFEATGLSYSRTSSKSKKRSFGYKWKGRFSKAIKNALNIDWDIDTDNASVVETGNNKFWEKEGLSVEEIVERFSQIIQIIEKKNKWKDWKTLFKNKRFELIYRSKNNRKKEVVFIIDELDTYDNDKETINPESVLKIIKAFKNLFTLSSAKFIFIVGNNTYQKSKNDPYRTLFTEKCYISVPDGVNLSKYLDTLVVNTKDKSKSWEELKWYFISLSGHNFFDLIHTINSFSEYNEKSGKFYINPPEINSSEKLLISFHYIVNAVFSHFRQSSIFESYNNNLFNELISIENNLKEFLFENIYQETSLDIQSTDNHKVNKELRDAKKALVNSIFQYTDQNKTVGTETKIGLPWNELREKLTFQKATNGILGIVTSNEISFTENIINIIKDLNINYSKYLGYKITIQNLNEAIKTLSDFLYFQLDEDLSKIIETNRQINTKPIIERDWDITAQALQAVANLSSVLLKFKSYDNSVILKEEWGEVNIKNSKIELGNDISHNNKLASRATVFFPSLKDEKAIEVNAKIKLSQNSLVNFLFYREYAPTEIDSEFYMVRLDSRIGNYDSILFKPKGQSWNFISNKTKSTSSYKRSIDLHIKIKSGHLELYKKKKLSFKLIERVKVDGNLILMGLSNELEKVEVSNLKLNVIKNKSDNKNRR